MKRFRTNQQLANLLGPSGVQARTESEAYQEDL
jgi:hypothetical protein